MRADQTYQELSRLLGVVEKERVAPTFARALRGIRTYLSMAIQSALRFFISARGMPARQNLLRVFHTHKLDNPEVIVPESPEELQALRSELENVLPSIADSAVRFASHESYGFLSNPFAYIHGVRATIQK